jgi:hypothetical protein
MPPSRPIRTSGDGYYYKGVAYASMASDKPADQRVEDYEQARKYLLEARKSYQGAGSDQQRGAKPRVISLIETWGYEHNMGVQPLSR